MPRWTAEQLSAYEARHNLGRICPKEPEQPPGMPLVNATQGEDKGRQSPALRDEDISFKGPVRILFVVFSPRPCDCDNYRTKDIQDCLVHAGILADDSYKHITELTIISRKGEPKTEIVIETI